jgi:hypothetical protein
MDTTKHKVDDTMDWYWNPDPKAVAEEEARDALFVPKEKAWLNDVLAGKMTEDEYVAAVLQLEKELGYTDTYTPKQQELSVRSYVREVLQGSKPEPTGEETGTSSSD